MTLDEAIEHAEQQARDCLTECRIEHKQLADWLRQLKEYDENAKYLLDTTTEPFAWYYKKAGRVYLTTSEPDEADLRGNDYWPLYLHPPESSNADVTGLAPAQEETK